MKRNHFILSMSIILAILLSVTNTIPLSYATALLADEEIIEYTQPDNSYQKLHFYIDNVEHAYIDSATELKEAVNGLAKIKNTERSVADSNDIQNSRSSDVQEVRITVEFVSNYTQTDKYKSLMAEQEEAQTMKEVNKVRSELKDWAREYHTKLIKENIHILSDFEANTVNTYDFMPHVEMYIDPAKIEVDTLTEISDNVNVKHVSVSTLTKMESESLEYSTLDQALDSINVSDLVDNSTYTGEGVKIGIWESEGNCDRDNPNLSNLDITLYDFNAPISPHATAVTSVVALIAPEAEYYVANSQPGRNYLYHLNYFYNIGCHIINCSWGVGGDFEYKYYLDGVFDYFVQAHNVTIVKSAGNFHRTNNPQYRITSPGYAHNVITVGGVDRVSDTPGALEHNPSACYVNNSTENKPNVSAIFSLYVPNVINPERDGTTKWPGTSFCAPQVTGIIALMIDKTPSISSSPAKILSTLTANAKTTSDYNNISYYNHFNEKVGAGVVDAYDCISSNVYITKTVTNTSQSDVTVITRSISLSAGQSLQVAVAWLVGTNSFNSNQYPTQIYLTDYDLELYDANGNLVAGSLSSYGNVELIRYTATAAGTYTIKVIMYGGMDSANADDKLSLCIDM